MTEGAAAISVICFEHRKSRSATPRGGVFEARRDLLPDRRLAFIRNKSKSNRKSPRLLGGGGGAGQNPRLRLHTDLRPSHSGIFFPWLRHLPSSARPKGRKADSFQCRRPGRTFAFAIYFRSASYAPRGAGGVRKSAGSHCGTGGPATQTLSRVSEKFFSAHAGRICRPRQEPFLNAMHRSLDCVAPACPGLPEIRRVIRGGGVGRTQC